MAKKIPVGWPNSELYIHFHEENAKRAAGVFGTSLYDIRSQATAAIKSVTGQRFSTSIFAGKKPADLKKFANEISDIEDAVSDTDSVVNYLQELLINSVSQDNNFASLVSNKISSMIGNVSRSSKKKLTQQITELLDLIYNVDLNTLISMKSHSPIKIDQAQYQILLKLQKFLDGTLDLNTKDKRNLLVDIFTEQGLPDFLNKCAQQAQDVKNDLIQSAIHLGSTRIQGSSAKAKPDIMMTFNLPMINGKKEVSQGISVKSNYLGMAANVLSTTLSATLKYSNGGGNMEAQVNALSLMDVKWLGRWLIWANLDRILQGTSKALSSIYNLQDRADILLEFTADGFQVYNLNDILYKLASKIQDLNITDTGKLGFGMRQEYNALQRYDRSKFSTFSEETITERFKYSESWLTATHIIVVDANRLINALR